MSSCKQYLALVPFILTVIVPGEVKSYYLPKLGGVRGIRNGLPSTVSQRVLRPQSLIRIIDRYVPSPDTTKLKMGSFGGKRNKQAELQRKLEIAKKQQSQDQKQTPLSAEEIKILNDKKRFEDLLNSESATAGIMDEFKDGSYLTKKQEEEELTSRYGREVKAGEML
jgi:hypothetical protein